eukprot:TRINITY_DN11343_c0_g1_i2.p1 TRINITY_DN11343_c0_g1~~TRINITY_DN11343_c0_g1_i2.p1  ORF type:complete len:147 (+),score=35.00 TRINITY_DN11343_c0_g1_i2:294-734(+)
MSAHALHLAAEETPHPVVAIGLMSGTSMDAIDCALLVTDGERVFFPHVPCPSLAFDISPRMREQMLELCKSGGDNLELERQITLLHASAVNMLLEKNDLRPSDIDIIGFHGQTISHRPAEHLTCQLGDASLLAEYKHCPPLALLLL